MGSAPGVRPFHSHMHKAGPDAGAGIEERKAVRSDEHKRILEHLSL